MTTLQSTFTGGRESRNPRSWHRLFSFKALRPALLGLAAAAVATFTTAPASATVGEEYVSTIVQVSSGRYVDAHEFDGEDWRLVTRTAQNNTTQLWHFKHQGGGVYTIQQLSNSRYVDAHEHAGEDYRLVTRPAQGNTTQLWQLRDLGNGVYTIQQVSNGRYVDAHEHAGEDYRLVTRTAQNNTTQMWRIEPRPYAPPAAPVPDPNPPVPVDPPIQAQGSFEFAPLGQVNLDNGNVGFSGADLAYEVVNLNQFYVTPVNGAAISVGNNLPRGYAGCNAAVMSNAPVDVLATLSPGMFVCVRTSEGKISEFRINNIGLILRVMSLSFTTWQ
ncbi:MAG: RICIN domain-containing protein [Bauldia sp.]|nr:RICIN domain-containing protein [Bauldia sp.]